MYRFGQNIIVMIVTVIEVIKELYLSIFECLLFVSYGAKHFTVILYSITILKKFLLEYGCFAMLY